MIRNSLHVRLVFALLLLIKGSGEAVAADLISSGLSNKQPVLLTAREVGYDQQRATATAIGNVEVVQGDTILLADRITYDQNADTVHATGHVSVLEPTGDVIFSDDALLKDQLQKGIVQQIRIRLKDNSLFAAREADKINKNITKLKNAVYSPCHVCTPKPGEDPQAPLWQMQARTATINEETQRVTYHDAFMDVYGVPVLYTPYFSHPTPDAPSQSGLLIPQYFHASDLGNVVKQPVYLSIAPNMDATLTPWYLSGEKPLLEGEFRHLTPEGYYEIRGAVTDTYNRDDLGNVIPGDEVRGYIDAHGKLQLNKYWDAGVDAERTTDDTFLLLYRFGWQDMLSSRLYAERIEDRSYFSIESLAFQGLQPQDIGSQSPYVLPQANFHFESDPLMAHSRLEFDSNALVLERQEGDTDQRVSSTVGWKLPYITHNGQVFETTASLRGDAYNVNNQPIEGISENNFTGQTGRVIPQVDMNWRYPLINRFSNGSSLMISPIIEAVASPNLQNSPNIPNEDSQIAELNDTNLFSPDRFSGLDQVESGLRGAYGMRGQMQFTDKKYVEWLFGQAYQQNDQSPFPIASSADAHYSDYIGRVAMKYKWVDIAYSFRIDRETLAPTSNEVSTNFVLKPLTFDVTYVSLKNEPLFGDRKEVFGNTALELTPHWTWNVSGRKDLGSTEETPENINLPVSSINPLVPSDGTVGLNTALVFHNECMMITSSIGRSYISVADVKPSTTIGVVLVLKNFGSTDSTTHSDNIMGAGNITSVNAQTNSGSVNPVPTSNDTGMGSTH